MGHRWRSTVSGSLHTRSQSSDRPVLSRRTNFAAPAVAPSGPTRHSSHRLQGYYARSCCPQHHGACHDCTLRERRWVDSRNAGCVYQGRVAGCFPREAAQRLLAAPAFSLSSGAHQSTLLARAFSGPPTRLSCHGTCRHGCQSGPTSRTRRSTPPQAGSGGAITRSAQEPIGSTSLDA